MRENNVRILRNRGRCALGLVVILAITPMLMGITAQRLYKDGQSLEEQDNLYAAALSYMDALDQNPNHRKSQEALNRVAEGAYEEKLAIAAEYEGQGRFEDALEEYKDLEALVKDLRYFNALNFSTISVNDKILEMNSSAAEQAYQQGEQAFAQGDWDKALDRYDEALFFTAGYKDAVDKLATCLYRLAEQDLESHNYRQAAKGFVDSHKAKVVPPGDAAMRAAEIHAALGNHFIEAGSCRQAVEELTMADQLSGGRVADDLVRARDCATFSVAMLPFDNPTGRNLAGMALGERLADATSSRVRKDVSEYVKIMERSALDAVLVEKGLSAVGVSSSAGTRLEGVDYLVVGKLTQVQVEHPGDQPQTRSVMTRQRYDCVKTSSSGNTYNDHCFRDVPVEYTYHSDHLAIRVAGSVTVVDVETGEQVGSKALDASARDSVEWADAFRRASNQESVTVVEINRRGGLETSDYAVLHLAERTRTLRSEGELASDVVEQIARDAAGVVVGSVDNPGPLKDPAELSIASLR